MAAAPDAHHLTLRYFDIRGKGELLRLLLEDVGAKYEDVRFQRAEWFATVKKQYIDSGIAPFGQVPILSVGTQHMAQTNATLRWLAKKFHRYGSNEHVQYVADMVADAAEDWRHDYVDVVYPAKLDEFDKLKAKYVTDRLAETVLEFEGVLKRAGPWFAGNEFTYADLVVFEMVDICLRLNPELLKAAPTLADHHKRVAERPNIKAYIASGRRPVNVNNSKLG